jgi:hypothetical protein
MASTRKIKKHITGKFNKSYGSEKIPKSSSMGNLHAPPKFSASISTDLPTTKFYTPLSVQGLLISLTDIHSLDTKHSPLKRFFELLILLYDNKVDGKILKENAADLLIAAKIQVEHLQKLRILLTKPEFIAAANVHGFDFELAETDSAFNKLLNQLENHFESKQQNASASTILPKSIDTENTKEQASRKFILNPAAFKTSAKSTAHKQRHSLELVETARASLNHSKTSTPNYSLDQLDAEIRILQDREEDMHSGFIQTLLELRRYLDLQRKRPEANGKLTKNEQVLLAETVALLKNTHRILQTFETDCQPLYSLDTEDVLTEYIKLVENTYAAETLALLNYEKNCKNASSLSHYPARLVGCIVITGLFSFAGCVAGGALGFLAGGGVFSAFTGLAGMTHGTITGTAIGALVGGWLFAIPAFAVSQHFLFAPTPLKQYENKIVAAAQTMFADEARDRRRVLTP